MPLAVETFTAELNGDLIEIRAGFDYVADGHELVWRFPDCFLADRETERRRGHPIGRPVFARGAVSSLVAGRSRASAYEYQDSRPADVAEGSAAAHRCAGVVTMHTGVVLPFGRLPRGGETVRKPRLRLRPCGRLA